MKIKLTAEARVLLNAGTVVDVEPATAETIIRLGKAVTYAEEQASEEADATEEKKAPAKKTGTKKK